MSISADGLSTAIQEVMRERLEGVDPRQATLPLTETGADVEGAADAAAVRKGGRPKGSKNRSTSEWREYLLGQFRSPLVVLAETYSRPIALLAAELGCTRLEAFKIQLAAAKELAPYVHQKQPLAVDLGDDSLVRLSLGVTAAFQAQVANMNPLGQMKVIEAAQDEEIGEELPAAIDEIESE